MNAQRDALGGDETLSTTHAKTSAGKNCVERLRPKDDLNYSEK